MTVVTTISICLAVVCAFLLGCSVVISNLRDNRNKALKAEVKTLNRRLDYIADSSKCDRNYTVEEDEEAKVYNVVMSVTIHQWKGCCYAIDAIPFDAIHPCLIKAFPFYDDKEFAKREAEELLDKLNEK